MRHDSVSQKALVSLLLVLILILGICCFTTHDSPLDLLVPALVCLFALLVVPLPSVPEWQQCAAPSIEPYTPAAPDRAPPA